MFNFDKGNSANFDMGGGIRYDSKEYRENISNFSENCLTTEVNIVTLKLDGGSGSGNFGHGGRPGKVGGSSKDGHKGKVTYFKRKNGKMKITSDVEVKTEKGTAIIKKGEIITKIVDFAGSGKKRGVRVESYLISQYGGSKGSWAHTRGETTVIDKGKEKRAEIHWFESKEVGQVGMKVKRFMEGENEG